jgi:hypothetical protein
MQKYRVWMVTGTGSLRVEEEEEGVVMAISGGGKLFVSGEDPSVTPTQVRGREKGRGEAGEEEEESGVLSLEGVAKSERKRPVDGVGWDMVGEGRPIRGVGFRGCSERP